MKPKHLYGIKYYGGKVKYVDTILKLIPRNHICYVEGFGGMMNMLLAKPKSPLEVYNDIDGRITNFWRVVQDRRLFKELLWRLTFTPYSLAEFERAKKVYEVEADPVTLAWAFAVKFIMSYNGTGNSFSRVVRQHRNVAESYFSFVNERLALLHERIQSVVLEQLDIFECIDKYDAKSSMFFLDPPYPPETLNAKLPYAYMMTTEEHQRFAKRLRDVEGSVILTTYATDYYLELLNYGYEKLDVGRYVDSTARHGRRQTWRVTSIFYKYAGDGNASAGGNTLDMYLT